MSEDRQELIPAYLLNDAQMEWEGIWKAISFLGWKAYGYYPETQKVRIECIVNIHQNGSIARTVLVDGEYYDDEDGPDYHPVLPSDAWGGIDVVLWREK
jgi:hypothetical protein